MTPQSRRANAVDELTKAEGRLRVADRLASDAEYLDAVQRLYYAAFHMVRAALFTLGQEPKSHRGVVNLLHQHFVQSGRLASQLAHVFSQLKDHRENADYTTEWVFTAEDWAEVRPRAEELLARLREVLREAGVVPAERGEG